MLFLLLFHHFLHTSNQQTNKQMNLLHHSLPFFIIFISTKFLQLHFTPVNSKTHPQDIQMLQILKNGFDPESISPGSCLSSWDFSFDPCDHIFTDRFTCGFRCDLIVFGSNRVTDIALDEAGYSGSLSHISFNFPNYLQTLDLSYNSISGSIPLSLSNLTLLRRLTLSKNSLTGPIPSSLGSLSRLRELYLDNNRLAGSIPPSFNRLVSLNRLELQHNNLSGELPDLSQLRSLCYLDLSDNLISGNLLRILPPPIIELSLRNNSLRGEFNVNVSELRSLQVLDLSYNELSGTIPSSLYEHRCLQQLTISHNNFTFLRTPLNDIGLVTSRLVAVDLSYNELHGLLPAFMAWMPELTALSLEHNKFTGMIPAQYAMRAAVVGGPGTVSFRRLLLGGNYLFGPIPGQLMGLKPGTVNVSLVDNCLYRCPDTFFFCQGRGQKSLVDCKSFRPVIP